MNTSLLNKQRSLAACLFLLPILFCLSASSVTWAQDQPNFPNLAGRVTDQAKLLSSEQKAELDQKLAAHEASSSNQIVVVTVKSLEGLDIADYALRLGRKWGIGTADKDNGVLLVVAPNERKVRIEVGYGLEGALPDGLAGTIVRTNILPSFRESDYPKGISNGVTAIEEAIRGEYAPPANPKNKSRSGTSGTAEKFLPLFFFGFIGMTQALKRFANKRIANAAFPASFVGLIIALGTSNLVYGGLAAVAMFLFVYFMGSGGNGSGHHRRSDGYTGGRSRGNSSGGFSGGGGGFGGGGASGSW